MSSTRTYLEELNELSQHQCSEARREVLRKITDLFFATSDLQNDSDTAEFGDVLENLAYSLEAEARIELSDRLAKNNQAPHKLIYRFATDELEIAQPVLEHSPCLSDDDLINIANSSSQGHLMAMTKRETLSVPVTDIIVDRGDDDVLTNIARNTGAKFSEQGLNKLSDRSESNDALRKALTKRTDVPAEIVASLKSKIAKKIAADMKNNEIDVSANAISAALDSASTAVAAQKSAEELVAEYKKIIGPGQLSQHDIVDTARARNIEKCIAQVSMLADMEPRLVRYCLIEAEIEALAILCKAKKFEDGTYAALLQLRLQISQLPSTEAIIQMERYRNIDQPSAQRVLRFLNARNAAAVN